MTVKTRIILGVILLGVTCTPGLISQLFTVYATPETQSGFLKQFDPAAIIRPFACLHSSTSSGEFMFGADWRSAHHEKDFDGRFIMRVENWVALMRALHADISSKLAADGGEILQQTGNPSTGFYVRYRRGHTLGEARIMPPQIIQPDLVDRRGVSSGEVALNLRISLKERWYASEADTLAQASTSSSDPGI